MVILIAVALAFTEVGQPAPIDLKALGLEVVTSNQRLNDLVVGKRLIVESFPDAKYRSTMCFSRRGVYVNEVAQNNIRRYQIEDARIKMAGNRDRDRRLARDKIGRYYIVGKYHAERILAFKGCD